MNVHVEDAAHNFRPALPRPGACRRPRSWPGRCDAFRSSPSMGVEATRSSPYTPRTLRLRRRRPVPRTGNSVADAAGPDTFSFKELLLLLASAMGVRSRFVRTPPVGGPRPYRTGRPAEARHCAHSRRGARPDGWAADIRARADRHDQAARLARRQCGRPGDTVRVRAVAKLAVGRTL